jgi:outer membrane protein OmpA-like peptidoglycan-associated protein
VKSPKFTRQSTRQFTRETGDAVAQPARSLQRKAVGTASDIPPLVNDVLNAPGQPLDAATRAYMEPRLNQDFSAVRIHSDERAAASARAVNAQAYTVGENLVFGSGQYAPQTAQGRKLLAHELAHVAQPQASGAPALSQPGDASEREADHAADAVAAGGTARVGAAGAALQRQPAADDKLQFKPLPPLSGGGSLLDNASPFLAAAAGSTTLDGFDTGKSVLKPEHQKQLASTAANIKTLLDQYPLSTVSVTGYADTVDTVPKNQALGGTRAAAVKQALIELGVPEAIIGTDSKGEGPPQAVKTPDETPNAKNRRVEVQFHPKESPLAPIGPQLTFKPPSAPGKQDEYDPPEKPPTNVFPPRLPGTFDDNPRPPFRPKQPDYFKPIPPLPKSSQPQSAIDIIGKKIIDPVVDKVAGGLSKEIRDKIKDGLRSAVIAGTSKSVRAIAGAEGVTDPQALDALENATKAAIQSKEQTPP